MKFVVDAWSKGGGRAGVLQVGSCPALIETPALLLSTRKALPNFIPPDLLRSLPSPDSRLLQFSPLHFLEGPSANTISDIGGVRSLVSLHEFGFAAIPRDSTAILPEFDCTNKLGASFNTPSGRHLLKPAEYMRMLAAMKPDIWASLSDEVPSRATDKRNKLSVDRTVKWLDECIALSPPGTAGFGAIVGGWDALERQRCAQEVAKRNVSGYWIGGFGLEETSDQITSQLLRVVVENLPEEKPRLVSGLGLPEEVLRGVAQGIDLFDSAYIHQLTTGGFALTFPFEAAKRHSISDGMSDGTKINLRADVYRKDTSPIMKSCHCYTCMNHTKAYINHLLNVREMLAQTLLEIHNTYHYLGFFQFIRRVVKEGRFQEFHQEFIETRRGHSRVVPADDVCA
uniref:Queuine tRNA-ribosyltransferase accessory subunit 2 n=1 Tax=Kalanchoe fedtschenkoi TaxID=63787 RepID=A0A7N0U7I0_KALFE